MTSPWGLITRTTISKTVNNVLRLGLLHALIKLLNDERNQSECNHVEILDKLYKIIIGIPRRLKPALIYEFSLHQILKSNILMT